MTVGNVSGAHTEKSTTMTSHTYTAPMLRNDRVAASRVGTDVISLCSFHGVHERGLGDVPPADLPCDPAVPHHQDAGAQREQVLGVGGGHDDSHALLGLPL